MPTKSQPVVTSYYRPYRYIQSLPSYAGQCRLDEAENTALPASPLSPVTPVGSNTITYGTGRQHFNSCDHTQQVLKCSTEECRATWCQDVTATYKVTYSYGHAFKKPFAPVSIPPIQVTSEMRKLAWQALLPQLNDGFSMANFLFELRDITQLFKQAMKLKRMMDTFDKRLIGSKTASELTLAYSFGLAPLYSDVKEIVDLLHLGTSALHQFVNAGKTVKSYHYRSDQFQTQSTLQTTGCGAIRHSTLGEFNATLRCSYEYSIPSEWKAMLRLWGLTVTFEHIWNAIPFSFVIDWVYGIARYLRQFDVDPNLRIRIADYCDSWKTTSINEEIRSRSGTYFLNKISPGNIRLVEGQAVWQWKTTRYVRTPGYPEIGYALPVLDSLSLRELVLAGALLRART